MKKKNRVITAPAYIKIGKNYHLISPRCRIRLITEGKGVIVKDGRMVKKFFGKWIYIPQKGGL